MLAMADKILEFLHYGANPTSISSLTPSSASPFLPSLVLSAFDSPSLTSPLLTPLVSNPDTPHAFAYASLDYSDIPQSVLELEAAAAEGGGSPTADEEADDFALSTGPEESAQLDESVTFEMSDEKERVKLVVFSLRKRALEFSRRTWSGENPEKVWHQQQKDEGSIWNNDVCIPELLCLLPIATHRCPAVLHPEHIVWGLLTARWGFVLLFSVLINNPFIVKEALSLLSLFVASNQDTFDRHSSISAEPSTVALSTQSFPYPPTKHQLNKKAGEPLPHSQGQTNVIITHCVEQALLTLIRLSKLSNSMACLCREALVRNHALAGLVLYMTSEFLHDELKFLSRMIFSDQKTSEWMLAYLGNSQKDSSCPLVLLIEAADAMNESCLMGAKHEMQSTSRDDSCNYQQGATYHVRKALLADAHTIRQKYGWCGQLHAHLRLYCVIIRAAELQPTHEEIEFWLKSLSGEFEWRPSELLNYPPKGNGSPCERTLQLGMSFFCLVPTLTGPSTRSLFHKCLSALLRSNISEGLKRSSKAELAVWIAVQLLLRHFSDIAMVVREVLGMHVTVHNNLMRELHDAAVTSEIISEPSLLVKAVASLRPKGPISKEMKHGSLTLKCLEQLLGSGHFSRHGVDISEAVLHCISVSSEPIHALMTQIIQAYAEAPAAFLQGKPGSQTFRMLPLPRSFLEDSLFPIPSVTKEGKMEGKKLSLIADRSVRAALASYYMLCRENFLRNVGYEAGSESSESLIFNSTEGEENWWSNLLAKIPYQQLIWSMEKNWPAYEHLFPQWLSLASVLFPEWLHVRVVHEDHTEAVSCSDVCTEGIFTSDDLEWAGSLVRSSGSLRNGTGAKDPYYQVLENDSFGAIKDFKNSVALTADTAKRAIGRALQEPVPALQVLKYLCCNTSNSEENCKEEFLELQMLVIKELVPMLLDMQCSRFLQDNFCIWWLHLQPIMRQMLIPLFVESVLDLSWNSHTSNDEIGVVSAQMKELVLHLENQNSRKAYNELVQEPLILLACKQEVYRTPVLSILLDVLSELLTVNRRVCLGIAFETGREGILKADEVNAALIAQDSAVCQILLEACVAKTSIDDKIRPGPLLEARREICGFLSSFLQTNHLLLKLLHFQAYDPQLVPMMVEGVSVMVQCLSFVSELLQQQQQSKQIFAIILIANVAAAHRELPESFTAVQQAIAHVSFVQHNVSGSSEFLQGVLGAMTQCASAFPKVASQVLGILQSCVQSAGPLSRCGPPRDPALQLSSLAAFKQLIRQNVLFG